MVDELEGLLCALVREGGWRVYQLVRPDMARRAAIFVEPPAHKFRFYEEPAPGGIGFVRGSGFDVKLSRIATISRSDQPGSRFAITWRGLRRPHDRERGIGG